ncbi:SgcJ/EcaC family oxidoreductase [Micrococcus sp. HG099]|uniref:SgcJ/EcaC family oxidoreductase n=1 Tax=Micrococcus sp. HG099 TaxID=2969755 RepID=UPI00215AD4F1|nr:SgcJ/EcaC family oxidoreductase [Micrococcus sp. HG099]MCR8675482.1 SgcJ/EcaC family oxidoreductase [Micrococcus sp. HG099]
MSPADPSPRLPARPSASPAAVAEAFEAAWNAADADALANLFAEDADFVTVLGVWWTRRRQIRLEHARGFRWMFPESRLEMDEVRVRDLGDVAVVHAPWTMTGPGVGGEAGEATGSVGVREAGGDGSGGGDGERTGVLLLVVRRDEAGAWEVVAAQNTDRSPEPRPRPADEDDDDLLAEVHPHPSAWLHPDDGGPAAG